MVSSNSLANPSGSWLGSENSLAKSLNSAWVRGVYVSTEDDYPLPVMGFSLKGAMITSDFMSSFSGEGGGAVGRVDGRERGIASGLGNSDKRDYTGGAEGETGLMVVTS